MLNIRLKPLAQSDLIDIWQFIARENPEQADLFLDRIGRKLQTLARMPKIGKLRPELTENLRSFPIGRYIIFYILLETEIEIIRILHGARDIQEVFEQMDINEED